MKDNWKQVKVGDFVKQTSNSTSLVPSESYTLLGMSLEGRGLFVREQKKGSEIGSKHLNKLQSGLFIYSRLFAWKGAFDSVTDEFDGCYVSDEYPTFKVDNGKADVRFLHYYFNQAKTWKAVEQFCIGVTKASRNRFKEKFFLDFPIDLPDLKTQKEIVSRIESIEEKRNQIFDLIKEQTKEINNLLFSKYTELIGNASWIPMKEVAPIIRRPVVINDEALYPELGIRCFGNGTFHKPALTGTEVATKKIFQIKKGDLLFSNVFAWEGGIAIAKESDDNRYGSHRFISCLVNEEMVLAEYLCYHFLSTKGLEDINACSPGGAGRNKTLGMDKLMKISVPIPPIELQREFVQLLEKTNAIKEHHKKIEQDLNELLPSFLDKAFKGELFPENSVEVKQEKTRIPVKASVKKDDLELAMIIALIESKLGNSYGEVGLQKTVFNIEAFYPSLRRKYNFTNYHFGTYSKELKEDIKSNQYLGKKVIKDNEVFTVSSSYKKEVLNAISDNDNIDFILSVNQVLDIYTSPFIGKQTDKIELLNTVTKLIIDLQTSDVNTIYDGMKDWTIKQETFKTKADKFSITDTRKTIELLKANGLIEKLIKV